MAYRLVINVAGENPADQANVLNRAIAGVKGLPGAQVTQAQIEYRTADGWEAVPVGWEPEEKVSVGEALYRATEAVRLLRIAADDPVGVEGIRDQTNRLDVALKQGVAALRRYEAQVSGVYHRYEGDLADKREAEARLVVLEAEVDRLADQAEQDLTRQDCDALLSFVGESRVGDLAPEDLAALAKLKQIRDRDEVVCVDMLDVSGDDTEEPDCG